MDLSGLWRAAVADDDVRRVGVELDADDSDWATLAVPGHWRSSAEFAGSDGPILYRRPFALPLPDEGQRQWMVFDGLCYQADVWLDGAYLGDPEGYFVPHAYDITDIARLREEHLLAVEVACVPQPGQRGRRNITGVLQGVIDKTWNPGGLWQPVRIEATGPVRMQGLRVLCRDASEARAHLRFHGKLDSDVARTVDVNTFLDGVPMHATEHSLAHGLNDIDWNIDIDDPRLWWPWSLGEQHLVEVTVEVLVDGVVSHRRQVRTGLREVAMHDWKLSVNGEQLFVKGANLLPTKLALADVSVEEARGDVLLARDAGLDLVRVHGHIASSALYDAADELGMLVWQDFPLQWEHSRQVKRQAVRQAAEAVLLLGHHPSIAVWCAHNSPDGERSGGLVAFAASRQLPSWNRTVLDRGVKRAFEHHDDTRPVVAHSGVVPHLPQLDGSDSHLFCGWRDGDQRELERIARRVPRLVRFVSEFGSQSAPIDAGEAVDASTWPKLDWDALESRGTEREVLERLFPPDDYATFEQWADASQAYQAQLLKYHIEALRRLKYRPTGGFCLMALNDSVPSVGWGILDHRRVPKAAYAAVMEACRPVIITIDRLPEEVGSGDHFDLDVHVVSDLRRRLDGVIVSAHATWPGGERAWRWEGDIAADECVRVGRVRFDLPPDLPTSDGDRLVIDLTLEAGDVVASNRDHTVIIP